MANTSSPTLLGNRLPFNLPFGQAFSGTWSKISTDNNFAAAINTNGLLYAWGTNTSGQVGDGTTITKSSPVQISASSFSVVSAGWDHSGAIDVNNNLFVWGNSASIIAPTVLFSWKKISHGFSHVLAIRSDDTLWAWGQNTIGQLGDLTTLNRSSPVQLGTGSWIEVSAGVSHSLALNSNYKLFAWGLNLSGQLGIAVVTNRSSPVQVDNNSWIAISAGGSFSVALKSDNTLYNWGLNAQYQLGDLTTFNRSSPVQLGTTSYSIISAGYSTTAAITTTGLLYVWGASTSLPDPTPTTIYSWLNIGGGTNVSGAVRSDGKLYAWGENTTGQLAQIIDVYRRSSPVAVASSNYTQLLVSSFTQIGFGDAHGVALTTDGQIYAWGRGTEGQLGNNSAISRSSPVTAPATGTSFYQQVDAGWYATYAITKSSTSPAYALYGWGAGTQGELAQVTNAASRSNPVLIKSGTSFTKVTAGNGFAAGLTTDNTLFIWGLGTSGQLGELQFISKSSPIQVPGSWTDVAAGTQHVVGVQIDGTLWTWGVGNNIGLVVEPESWTNVSMGLSHAVAITSGGTLYTWGLNTTGQLGGNSVVSRSSPTQINLSSYVVASANGNTTYAIRSDNSSLWGWGLNSTGQIGDNTTIDKSNPVQIVFSLSSYSQVAAGVDHVLAITSNNLLYSWGRNTAGQLGTNNQTVAGDTINRSTPVTVNIFSPQQISAGTSFSTAIDASGILYAWGLNASGQLGDKTTINRSAPVNIGTSLWTKVSSGVNHNLAIRTDGTLWTWGSAAAINLLVEPESWSQIAYGTDHIVAIRSDGALFTWGKNDVGQLGLNDVLNRSSPTIVTSLGFISWTTVGAGNSFSLGITGGLVYTWGLNSSGQLGDLSTINRSNPVLVNAPSTRLLTFQNSTLIDNSNYNATVTTGAVSSRYPYPQYNIGSYAGNSIAFNTLQFSTVTRGTAGDPGSNSTTNGKDGLIFFNFPYSYGVTNSSATILSSISPAISGKTSWTLTDGAITLNTYGTTTFSCDANVTVPVVVYGAGGGTTCNIVGNGGNGGAGGLTYAFVNLVAGTSYRVIVGQGGTSYSVSGQAGAGGGGGSGIELATTSNPVIVAGGGGGAGGTNSGGFGYNAGAGGGSDGQRNTVIAYNASGGSQTAAGAGAIGSNGYNGESGSNRNGGRGNSTSGLGGGGAGGIGFGNGASGATGSNGAAGGGGGGYWGGGGGGYGDTLGPGGSGGGGSGYLNPSFVSNSITVQSNLYTVATVASTFDGYAIVPYNNGFDIPAATNWTFECYLYLSALPSGANQYVIAGRNWNFGTSGPTWAFAITSTGVLQWAYGSTGVATNVLTQTGAGAITTGSWIHIACVKNTSNLASIYVNGTSSASRTDTNAMTSATGDLYVGKASNLNANSQFNGYISDIRIVYGVAVYTGNFTVPTRTLSASQSSGTNISAISAGTSFEFVEAGFTHVIGYTSSKTPYVWGQNTAGQLGDNTTINKSSPTTLASPWATSSFVAVSAGNSFTLGVDSTGTLWTWGLNTSGQLGLTNADLISRSSPVQVGYSNYFSWTKVSAGSTHSLGISTNNSLYTWGNSSAVLLPVTVYSWSQVATGNQSSHSAAIRSDGMLFVWGLNTSGQLGDRTTVSKSSPVQTGTLIYSQVSLGADFTLAKGPNGTLYSWGNNASGQLGDGTIITKSSPTLISASSYTQISAGNAHAFALKNDGTTLAWGVNNAGQLGDNTTVNKSTFVTVNTGGVSSYTQVSAGSSFSTGIDSLGRLLAWGLNNSYQLGDAISSFVNRSTPTLVPLPSAISFSNISSGVDHSIAIDTTNKLWTWGNPLAVGVNVNSWTQLAIGPLHSLALRNDGRMFAWGRNTEGQLGQLNVNDRSYPIPVGSSSWTAIAAGYLMSAAIRTDGTLWTWGYNINGQLGQVTASAPSGDTINRSSPTQVSGAVSVGSTLWTQVTAGLNFTAGINDGKLYVWGLNSSGQLGNNSTLNRSSPVQIGSISNYSQVSAGWNYVNAITQDYKMYAFGLNTSNQLGDNTTANKSNPVQIGLNNSWITVSSGYNHSLAINYQNKLYIWGTQNAISLVPLLQSWTAISSGIGSHTMAIRSDGLLYAWGLNSSGQLGDGTTTNRNSPVLVSTSNFISIATGAAHSLAIREDDTLWAWGNNATWQLGDGLSVNRSSPVQVGLSLGLSWSSVAAGASHSAAINSLGKLYMWGASAGGAIGDNQTAANRSSPTLIGTSSWTSVSLGSSFTAAITSIGTLFAWGLNSLNQLGDATTVNKSSPVQIGGGLLLSFINVSAGLDHSAAITTDYKLYAWGSANGVLLQNSVQSWTKISAGVQHTVAVRSDGLLYAWGLNNAGQLGDSTTTNRSSPVIVTSDLSWSQVAAGDSHTLAIRSNGLIYAWGLGTSGQLGFGTAANRSSPVLVTSLSSYTQVKAGAAHSLAIKVNGIIEAWGLNSSGELGQTDTINRSAPLAIGTSSWSAISAGSSYSTGIDVNGKLYGWGLNNTYQIGDGTTTPKSNPVLVGGDASFSQINTAFTTVSTGVDHNLAIDSNSSLWAWGNASAVILTRLQGVTSWTKMAAGASHTLAIRSDGMLFAWGLNNAGQLGDGTAVTKSSPTIIGNFSWNVVGAGQSHSFAIRSDGILFAWGLGTSGQLGLVTSSVNRSSPVQIGTSSWTSVSGGNLHSIGVDVLGRLYTWGAAAGGQTGQNNTTTLLSPVQLGSESWTSVSAGTSHSLAIKNDNTLYAWGINTSFQIGDGTSITKSSPVQIGLAYSWSAISSEFDHNLALNSFNKLFVWGPAAAVSLQTGVQSWAQVAIGGAQFDFAVAIREDGTLWSWGDNSSGQLGIGLTTNRSSPVLVSASSWTSIAAGDKFALAIRSDGILFTWGDAGAGLGDGTTINKSIPVQIGNNSWKQVSTTGYSSSRFAIRLDDTLWGWGDNLSGALGINDVAQRSSPVQIGSSTWKAVTTGYRNSLGIFNDDTLYVWGINSSGSLGLNDTINRSNPVQLGTETYIKIAAMVNVSAAIRSDNTLWLWGLNNAGHLGDGTTINKSSPVQINGGGSWTQITLISTNNSNSALALKTTNTLWAWGQNTNGALGQGTTATNRSSPIQVGTSSWTSVGSGMVANISRIAYVWGRNIYGSLGDNTTINKSSPVALGSTNINATTNYIIPTKVGNSSWTAVNAGTSYSLAILSNNNVFAWGLNSSGQLGNNSSITKSSPVLVANGAASFIMAGGAHGFAWSNTANFRPFGLNNAGQLGINDNINRSSATVISLTGIETQFGVPTRINNTLSWTSVSAGQSFSLAVPTTGALYAWGVNSLFQLGDNTSVGATRSSPTVVATGNSWTVIAAGKSHSTAIKTDNTIYAWGSSVSGQIGDNATVNRSSPTQLASTALNTSVPVPTKVGDSSWTQVAAGNSFTAAIRSDSTIWVWGLGTSGQIGNNSAVSRSSPVQISGAGTSSYTQLGGSASSLFAIQTTSLLYAWGLGTTGQLGDSAGISRSNPTLLSPISVAAGQWPVPSLYDNANSYSYIAAGNSVSLAIRSTGQLFTWGLNNIGQIGDNTTISKSSPIQIGSTTDLGSWLAIGAGKSDLDSAVNPAYAITTNYNMYGWGGRATNPGIGDNSTISKSSPVQIPASSANFGTTVISKIPVFNDTSFNLISAGTSYSMARTSSGNTVFAWGINNVGQFLDTTVTNASVPVIVGQSPIVVDTSQTALTVTTPTGAPKSTIGSPFASGSYDISVYGGSLFFDNSSRGLIAANSTLNIFANVNGCSVEIWFYSIKSTVTQHILTQDDLTSTGQVFYLSITSTNLLTFNYFVTSARASVVTLSSTTTANVNSWNHALVTLTGVPGTLRLFLNGILQSSNSSVTPFATTAIATGIGSANGGLTGVFNGYLTNLRMIGGSIPTSYQTASTTTGTVVFTVPTSPLTSSSQGATSGNVVFLGLRNLPTYSATAISAQQSVTSLINASNSQIITGGLNNVGQLGPQDIITRSFATILGNTFTGINTGTQFPFQVTTSSFTQIAAGTSYSVAVDSTRRLFTWGLNTNGQLGDSSTITKSSPVQVATSANLVSAFANNIAYIDNFSSKLYAWGLNSSWQLGDFSSINKSSPIIVGNNQALNSYTNSPVQVRVGYSNFVQVAAGLSYSIAVDSNNNAWGWGLNSLGQLGLSDTINRSIATQISSGTPITNAKAGTATALTDTTQRIYEFGYGLSGLIGTQEAINRSAPVMIGNSNHINTGTFVPVQIKFQLPSSWTSVAAGGSHSLAENSSGQVYAWGRGTEGQLGNNGIINRSIPVLVGTSFSSISAGDSHSLAIGTNNKLYTWGYNVVGQVGNDSTVNVSSPTLIGGQLNTMTASPIQVGVSWNSVSVGNSHTLAIGTDSLLYAWGKNDYGQLGDNSIITKSSIVQVSAVGTQFVDTSDTKYSMYPTGPGALMVLVSPFASGTYDPAIYGASGSFNGTDYLITENKFNENYFYNNEFTIEAWINPNTLSGGGDQRIFDLWYSPYLFLLRLNNALIEFYVTFSPTNASPNFTVNYTISSAATWYHVAVVKRYDSQRTIPSMVYELYVNGISRGTPIYNDSALPGYFDWYYRIGINFAGYISNVRIVKGTAVYTANFTPPVLPLSNIAGTTLLTCQEWDTTNTFTSVSAGNSFSLAKHTNGRVYGWGLNNFNQIGNYGQQWRSVPSLINSGSWSQITAGFNSGLGIKNNLYGWGQNTLGQLGDNSVVTKSFPNPVQGINYNTLSPTLVGSSFTYVSAGVSTTAAIKNDNTLYVWGQGGTGQIGNLALWNKSSPTQVYGSFSQVFVGTSSLFAINTNNKLYAWGLGTVGQTAGYMTILTTSSPNTIGNNYLSINQSSPALLDAGSWIAITAGNLWSAAVRSDGALFTWGNRTDGTLGDGLIIPRSMMMQIGTRSYTQVSGQQSHGVALSTTGEVFTWGLNSAGQLGITSLSPGGDVIQRSSITLVGSNYSQVSAGISYTAAIRTNGQLYAWGLGTSGELGYGTAASRSSPVAVSGNLSWTSLNAGYLTAGAITTTGLLYNWGASNTYQLASIWYNAVSRSIPTQVGNIWAAITVNTRVPIKVNDSSWIGVDAGYYNSIGIPSNNRLYTWGYNTVGRLGTNTTLNRSDPTVIGTYTYLSNTVSLGAFNVAVIGKGTFGDPTGGY